MSNDWFDDFMETLTTQNENQNENNSAVVDNQPDNVPPKDPPEKNQQENAPMLSKAKPQEKFNCSECEKSFHTKYLLKRHVEARHQGIKYPCKQCGKKYSYVGNRAKHERNCKIQQFLPIGNQLSSSNVEPTISNIAQLIQVGPSSYILQPAAVNYTGLQQANYIQPIQSTVSSITNTSSPSASTSQQETMPPNRQQEMVASNKEQELSDINQQEAVPLNKEQESTSSTDLKNGAQAMSTSAAESSDAKNLDSFDWLEDWLDDEINFKIF